MNKDFSLSQVEPRIKKCGSLVREDFHLISSL